LLTLIWLYIEQQPTSKIANHAWYTFWYVIPTLPMFLAFPWLMSHFDITEKVSMLGLVNNPCDYFAMADICVFPSHQGDGLMGTVLESMAAGKPVITTINNGNEDVIENGKNGILIKPNNVQDLKQAITDLIANVDKRKLLGENAEKFIAEHVAWEKNTIKLSDILTEIKEKSFRP
jgi:glycosyltransferase involved in cell wall biosynthesis